MRRHDESKRHELDARLDALQQTGSRGIRSKRRSNAGPTVLGVLLLRGVLGAIFVIYSAAT